MLRQVLFAPPQVLKPNPKKSRRHSRALDRNIPTSFLSSVNDSNKHVLPNLLSDFAAGERTV
jgi:hypothetical protein